MCVINKYSCNTITPTMNRTKSNTHGATEKKVYLPEITAEQQALANGDIFFFCSLHLLPKNSVKCFQCARWAKSFSFFFFFALLYCSFVSVDLRLTPSSSRRAVSRICVLSILLPYERILACVSGVKYEFKYE